MTFSTDLQTLVKQALTWLRTVTIKVPNNATTALILQQDPTQAADIMQVKDGVPSVQMRLDNTCRPYFGTSPGKIMHTIEENLMVINLRG